jgi:Ca2+/Na+ antiporter
MGAFLMGIVHNKGDFHMRLRIFFIVNAICALIAGIILVVVPTFMVNGFGLTPAASKMAIGGQLYGSELILMALVAWVARNIADRKTQINIVEAFAVANLISLVLSILALVSHTFDAVGWIAIAAYAILTAVYGGYLLYELSERRESQPAQQQLHQPS